MVAALVVCSLPALDVVWEGYEQGKTAAAYEPGFLATREGAPLLSLLNRCRAEAPELFPQVLLVDGCGILHPRGAGLACHIGVEGQVPTVGCAKTLMQHDNLPHEGAVRTALDAAVAAGARGLPLVGQSGKTWGYAVNDHAPGVSKPIYVSVGHRISLETAVEVVRACSRFRIPEPIRQADIRSRVALTAATAAAAAAAATAPASAAVMQPH